jgi:hypothetical protein
MKRFYKEKNGNFLELYSMVGVLVKSFIIQGMPNEPDSLPENLDDRINSYLSIVGGVVQSKPEPKTGVIDKTYLERRVKEGDLAPEVGIVEQSLKKGTISKKEIDSILDSLKFYRDLFEEIVSRTESIIF